MVSENGLGARMMTMILGGAHRNPKGGAAAAAVEGKGSGEGVREGGILKEIEGEEVVVGVVGVDEGRTGQETMMLIIGTSKGQKEKVDQGEEETRRRRQARVLVSRAATIEGCRCR